MPELLHVGLSDYFGDLGWRYTKWSDEVKKLKLEYIRDGTNGDSATLDRMRVGIYSDIFTDSLAGTDPAPAEVQTEQLALRYGALVALAHLVPRQLAVLSGSELNGNYPTELDTILILPGQRIGRRPIEQAFNIIDRFAHGLAKIDLMHQLREDFGDLADSLTECILLNARKQPRSSIKDLMGNPMPHEIIQVVISLLCLSSGGHAK
jgi:hypothetical protein